MLSSFGHIGTPFALAYAPDETLYCSVVNGNGSALYMLSLAERGQKHGEQAELEVKDEAGRDVTFRFVAGLSCATKDRLV
mmetsp:Transcript_16575/g.40573  ORF Transcript_16575/g.40573 Transcript_16575/m.40573 type:complete len:80 (-) Transcript_16575:193-432(-)